MPKHNYDFSFCLKGPAGLDVEYEACAIARIIPQRTPDGTATGSEVVQIEEIGLYTSGKYIRHDTLEAMFWNNPALLRAIYQDYKA